MAMLCALLVLIWSTGFIVGKLIVGLIDPNIYLGLRFLLAAILFFILAVVLGRPYPKWQAWPKQILAGVLMNGLYLGLAYVAIAKGLPAGMMALIGALQPVLVTLLAFLIVKEKTSIMGMVGMLIGIFGLLLVISPAVELDLSHGGVSLLTLSLAVGAILALSLGAVLQKMSVASADIIVSMGIQNLAASVVAFVLVLLLGESLFVQQWSSYLLLIWGAVILSGVGVFLMVWLLRKVKASQVAILLLLAPPLAAVESYFLFSETMTALQIIGFAVTIGGVYLSRVKA
ncbi:DMT family transporter [Marinomonas sp. THO17]|uniref:DMT family transporter n=1 Tax=Marinomonas sp. THO17 TaxID=3149048 RepID=UPI00336BC68F